MFMIATDKVLLMLTRRSVSWLDACLCGKRHVRPPLNTNSTVCDRTMHTASLNSYEFPALPLCVACVIYLRRYVSALSGSHIISAIAYGKWAGSWAPERTRALKRTVRRTRTLLFDFESLWLWIQTLMCFDSFFALCYFIPWLVWMKMELWYNNRSRTHTLFSANKIADVSQLVCSPLGSLQL